MLLEICGNCQTYKYDKNPSRKGGCRKTKGILSPLASVCDDYKPKRR